MGEEHRLDAAWIVPGTDTMIISRAALAQPVSLRTNGAGGVGAGRLVIGMTIETVRQSTDGDRRVLIVTFEERDTAAVLARTSTEIDASSLLPIRQRAELDEGRVVTLVYLGGRVIGVDSAADRAPRYFTAAAPDSAYTSAAVDVLLRALPLSSGLRSSIPLYFPAENLVQSIPVRVVGLERITTRAGRVADCWLVAADFPGGITEHFWLEQTSHAILRILAHDSETSLVRYDR